jgi:hypothetical protein
MPVEIRELVIRAVVVEKPEEQDGVEPESPLLSGSMDSNEAIVQECVRQILRILRKEKER